MSLRISFRRLALLSTLAAGTTLLPAAPGFAQSGTPAGPAAPAADTPAVTETIQVTATRVPEDVEPVPASITVVSGDELRARGATDLATALGGVAGLTIAPGGDNGPAGSVPEFWGLREFDAFLLVVDGVPWGGAFNPALTTLDLTGVDRIEVMRGAAPVMYGATSFVGVIHVIHRQAGSPGGTATVWGGNYGSGGAAVSTPLPALGAYQQSLTVNGEKQGFRDDRTQVEHGHVLYRGALATDAGRFHVDFDGHGVRQDPSSPRSIEPPTPLDANYNPGGAKIDEDRFHLSLGYDKNLGTGGVWSTTLAVTHAKRDSLRGFLNPEISEDDPNATGFEQTLKTDDVYFDTHVAFHLRPSLQLVAGLDHLYGKAKNRSEDFDYFVPLSGHGAPSGSSIEHAGRFGLDDERNFSGLYAQLEWNPVPRLRIQVGGRFNRTRETLSTTAEDLEAGDGIVDEAHDAKTVSRGSGVAGVSWLAWGAEKNAVWIYADVRNTFKPAALDFGPDAEGEILNPETARSYEAGLKGRLLDGRFDWEVSAFQMDFENLVVSQAVNDLPTLVNAGSERFKGFEVEAEYHFVPSLLGRVTWSYHDARYRDFAQLGDDGEPEQLRGNRLEASPHDLGSAELTWGPATGFNASVLYQYVGNRFLDPENTILASSYNTWSAAVGYRFARWEVRLQGQNLNDTRPPVAASELGPGQYYLLPARTVRLFLSTRF
jgi:iron complex outermembrane recepter protein